MCCYSGTFLVECTERYVVCGIAEPDPKRVQYGVTSLRRAVLLQFVTGGANRSRRLAIGCSKQSAATGCSARLSAVHWARTHAHTPNYRQCGLQHILQLTGVQPCLVLSRLTYVYFASPRVSVSPYATCWMDLHDINWMLDSFSPAGTFHCRSEPTKTALGVFRTEIAQNAETTVR
jgi:hypothetical protein